MKTLQNDAVQFVSLESSSSSSQYVPFMLSIVSKKKSVSFVEHHIKPNTIQKNKKKKKRFATSFATCMSGDVLDRGALCQVMYRCRLSCQAQGFP